MPSLELLIVVSVLFTFDQLRSVLCTRAPLSSILASLRVLREQEPSLLCPINKHIPTRAPIYQNIALMHLILLPWLSFGAPIAEFYKGNNPGKFKGNSLDVGRTTIP